MMTFDAPPTQRWAWLAALCLITALLPREALACGGCFSPPGPGLVVQDAERVLFHRDPGTKVTTAWVEVRYSGPAKDFGWVLPLPKQATVSVGPSYLFDRLDQAAAPRFATKRAFNAEGCVWDDMSSSGSGCGGIAMSSNDESVRGGGFATSAPQAPGERQVGVQVLARAQAGPYQTVQLAAKDAKPLLKWLNDNGYATPDAALPIIDSHLAKGDIFIAFKLLSGKGINEIKPVVLKMDDSDPCVPLRLTSIAAADEMNVIVYLLGEGRGVPKNHMHVSVNPMKLRWAGGVNNYPQAAAAAIDEAAGRAFVTEYAGPAKDLAIAPPPSGFGIDAVALYSQPIAPLLTGGTSRKSHWMAGPPLDEGFLQVDSFAKAKTVTDLVEAIRGEKVLLIDDFADILEARTELAKRHGSADVLAWYAQLRAGSVDVQKHMWAEQVDGAAIAKELKEGIIDPTYDVAQILKGDVTLTRLMMRISADEMDRDPMFAFNADLPDVAALHTAEVRDVCTGGNSVVDASRLTVQGGGSYILPDAKRDFATDPAGFQLQTALTVNSTLDARWKDAPFAMTVEVLEESGAPVPVAPGDVKLVDTAIAAAVPGSASLPKDLSLQAAGTRWTPPADDGNALDAAAVDKSRVDNGSCSQGGRLRQPLVMLGLLLLCGLLIGLRRRQDHRC